MIFKVGLSKKINWLGLGSIYDKNNFAWWMWQGENLEASPNEQV